MTVYSHSRLNTFENCPLQYRYRYVDRRRTDFESIEAFMGKRVHEVLEEIYADLPAARAAGLQHWLGRFEALWQETLKPNVRVIRPDMSPDWYRRLGGRCLEAYWRRHEPFLVDPADLIGLELKVELSLDPERKYRMMGFVDRAQHAGPGTIEIHDYKTTASLPKEGSLRWDRQLPLYEIALRQRYPETKEVRLIWHFLAHGTEVVERRTAQDLESLKRKTIALIQTVERAREFPAKKGPLCAWCDHQDICPEWKGERPLASPAYPNGVVEPIVPLPASPPSAAARAAQAAEATVGVAPPARPEAPPREVAPLPPAPDEAQPPAPPAAAAAPPSPPKPAAGAPGRPTQLNLF